MRSRISRECLKQAAVTTGEEALEERLRTEGLIFCKGISDFQVLF
jgi:hypothetical protein